MDDLIKRDAKGEIELPPGMLHKALSSDLADEVAELHIIQDVLQHSYAAMALYFERYTDVPPGSDDFIIRMSLFRDAIVQFASGFSRSDKEIIKPTPEEVYGHIEGWEQPYQIMLDLRIAYAAHTFGQNWHHDVFAIMEWNDPHDRVRLYAIGDTKGNFGGFAKSEEANTLLLIDIAREHVKKRLNEAREKLWNELVETSPDVLAGYPDYKPPGLTGFDETKQDRRKFRAAKRTGRVPRVRGRTRKRL